MLKTFFKFLSQINFLCSLLSTRLDAQVSTHVSKYSFVLIVPIVPRNLMTVKLQHDGHSNPAHDIPGAVGYIRYWGSDD
jgi:hypothetical protein